MEITGGYGEQEMERYGDDDRVEMTGGYGEQEMERYGDDDRVEMTGGNKKARKKI